MERKITLSGFCTRSSMLGLVTNAVVLWNTLYTEVTLKQLKADGFRVKDENLGRISPLKHKHINVLGRYSFVLSESIANGEFRPLNAPRRKHNRLRVIFRSIDCQTPNISL